MQNNTIYQHLAKKYFDDIFHNLGDYKDLFKITLIMQEIYINYLRLNNKFNKDRLNNFISQYQDKITEIIDNQNRS